MTFFNFSLKTCSLFLLFSFNVFANTFRIEPFSDEQYVLITPDSVSYNVIVDMQGAKELFYHGEYNVNCGGDFFLVSVIQSFIETMESNAEYMEYFVFDMRDGGVNAIKSIVSLYVIDRYSGDVIENHTINPKLKNLDSLLCPYILEKNSNDDYPIQKIDKTIPVIIEDA
ncbi:hypothetical protein [Vibrio cincinnatiensis]